VTLALSQEQIEILHSVASAVPPSWRGRFLSAVSDLLTMASPEPSNRQVIEAVSAARRAMLSGSSPGAYARRA
jgi:hypothetical protein